MKHEAYSRNKIAYLVGRVQWLGLAVPSIFVIWIQAGMSFADILLLQGLFGVVILLLEYPSGILADHFSRKSVLVGSKICAILGTLMYSFSNSFGTFLLAEVILGLALALNSGADSAMIWDSTVILERTDAREIITRGSSIAIGSGIVLTPLSGVSLLIVGSQGTLWLTSALMVSGLVTALMITEPTRVKLDTINRIWKESLVYLKNRSFAKLVLITMISTMVLKPLFWAYIPKLEELNYREVWYGLVLGYANIVSYLAISASNRWKLYSGKVELVILISAFLGALVFIPNLGIFGVLLGIALHQIARGLIHPVVSVQTNEMVGSEIRASLDSLRSMVANSSFFFVSIIYTMSQLSIGGIMSVTVGIVTVLVVVILLMRRSPRKLSD